MRFKSKGRYWLSILFLLNFHHFHTGNASWWELSQYKDTAPENPKLLCSLAPNLDQIQRKICRRRSGLILPLGASTREAITECQFQFRHHKWNCSVLERNSSVFGNQFIKGGTPELAFVQALTVASAVIGVSRACSAGVSSCGCALQVMDENAFSSKDFKMNGCTESTKFAIHFVRRFANGRETDQRDPKAKMTIFNNKAGRAGLLKGSTIRCKCHGVSGSCTVKSCWRFLPNIRAIGTSLKDKYDGAIKVDFDASGHMLTVDRFQRQPTSTNLIYFEDSPNGCVPDPSRGIFGTSGRLCDSESEGIDSCDILCCGQGYTTSRVSVTYKCGCSFQWCCEVKCKMCNEWKVISYCDKMAPMDGDYPPAHVAITDTAEMSDRTFNQPGVHDLINRDAPPLRQRTWNNHSWRNGTQDQALIIPPVPRTIRKQLMA